MSERDASAVRIVKATEQDVPLILRLITELAEYEQLAHQVSATEASLRASLFGDRPAAEAMLAYKGAEPAGFALFFQNFSTFLGRPGLYLEDLYVRPAWRRQGVGRHLLAHLARLAVERGCGRMEWAVLDWNEPALRLYRALGARPLEEWTVYRLSGDALTQLATSRPG